MTPLVLKFGGELLEERSRMDAVVGAVAGIARTGIPLVVVHGGGKEVDAALAAAGIEKRQVEGLRITDEATLDVVVSVLAGAVNTRFVAALATLGIHAVGLTGADDECGLSEVAMPHVTVDGRQVELGRVGRPVGGKMRVVETLLQGYFVPVVASIGIDEGGRLLNINADTMAGHFARSLHARRLVIAGSTAGVLDDSGRTIPVLDTAAIEKLISGGTATAGMVAKLRACEQALAGGVDDVVIVDGRDQDALRAAASGALPGSATRVITTVGTRS